MSESQSPVGYPEPTHSEQILRHVVGLQVQIHIAESRRPADGRMADAEIASAIIVSISEQWFLVTAGHLVDELRTRHQLGDRILGCRLLTLANSKGDLPTIPFGLIDPESATFLNADLIPFAVNQEGLDCLVVPIGDDLRELLDLRGIRALHESTWKEPLIRADMHYLAGLSASLARLDEESNRRQVKVGLQLPAPIIGIYPASNPPEKLVKPIERLFFHLPKVNGRCDGKPLQFDSPAGMSGGPIIAACIVSETDMRLCLVGIQSSWDKDSRVIAATPWPLVVQVIEKMIEMWEKSFESIPMFATMAIGVESP